MAQSKNDGVVVIAGVVLLLFLLLAVAAGGWLLTVRRQRAMEAALVAETRLREAEAQAVALQKALAQAELVDAESNETESAENLAATGQDIQDQTPKDPAAESSDSEQAVTTPDQDARDQNTSDGSELRSFGWLAGSWREESDGKVTEETWMPPRDGMMLGMSRSGKQFFEYIRIESDENGIRFLASPMGKNETPFRLKESGDRRVVFENLQNDFPQRIIYHRVGDELFARVDGAKQDPEQSLQWRYRIVAGESANADDRSGKD